MRIFFPAAILNLLLAGGWHAAFAYAQSTVTMSANVAAADFRGSEARVLSLNGLDDRRRITVRLSNGGNIDAGATELIMVLPQEWGVTAVSAPLDPVTPQVKPYGNEYRWPFSGFMPGREQTLSVTIGRKQPRRTDHSNASLTVASRRGIPLYAILPLDQNPPDQGFAQSGRSLAGIWDGLVEGIRLRLDAFTLH